MIVPMCVTGAVAPLGRCTEAFLIAEKVLNMDKSLQTW